MPLSQALPLPSVLRRLVDLLRASRSGHFVPRRTPERPLLRAQEAPPWKASRSAPWTAPPRTSSSIPKGTPTPAPAGCRYRAPGTTWGLDGGFVPPSPTGGIDPKTAGPAGEGPPRAAFRIFSD